MACMPTLRVEREGTIVVVTLAQPPANVMDAASLDELADVFEGLAGEPMRTSPQSSSPVKDGRSAPASTSRPSSTVDPNIRRR